MPVDASFHDRLNRIETNSSRPPSKKSKQKMKTKVKAAPKEERQKRRDSPLVTFFTLLPLTIIVPAIIGIGYVMVMSP